MKGLNTSFKRKSRVRFNHRCNRRNLKIRMSKMLNRRLLQLKLLLSCRTTRKSSYPFKPDQLIQKASLKSKWPKTSRRILPRKIWIVWRRKSRNSNSFRLFWRKKNSSKREPLSKTKIILMSRTLSNSKMLSSNRSKSQSKWSSSNHKLKFKLLIRTKSRLSYRKLTGSSKPTKLMISLKSRKTVWWNNQCRFS